MAGWQAVEEPWQLLLESYFLLPSLEMMPSMVGRIRSFQGCSYSSPWEPVTVLLYMVKGTL